MQVMPIGLGGGGASRPWKPKEDGLNVVETSYGTGVTGNSAWGSLANGGVVLGICGRGHSKEGVYALHFPKAGKIEIGGTRSSTSYRYHAGWLGHMWLPPGTTIGNSAGGRDTVVARVEGAYEDCLKMFPGLIDMTPYDEAGKLKGFKAGRGVYAPSSAANPNGCTIFYIGGSAFENHLRAGYWALEIRDSGGTAIANGTLVRATATPHHSVADQSAGYRLPLPVALDAAEQLYVNHDSWGSQYIVAHDPGGWA